MRFCWLILAASICLVAARAADIGRFGSGQGFKVVDYYPATNGVQHLKTRLTGSKFEMSTNNIVLLQDPRIESFSEDGKLEWIATSTDAVVNWITHSAFSTNLVMIHTPDTNHLVSAVGFLWQQSNGVLTLSNRVYTRIDKAVVGKLSPKP